MDPKFDPGVERQEGGYPDLTEAVKDFEEFNGSSNWGSLIAKTMIRGINKDAPSKWDEETLTADKFQELLDKHSETLDLVGISIQSEKANFFMLSAEEGDTRPNEAVFSITNTDRYRDFLSSLQPDSVRESDIKLLKATADALIKQFRKINKAESLINDEQIAELPARFSPIIDQYKRLDLKNNRKLAKPAEELGKIMEAAQNGYFREFLFAEQFGLMDWDRGFGPSKWHTDASPEYFQKSWQNCFNALDKFAVNPNARQAYNELLSKLKEAIKISKDESEKKAQEVTDPSAKGYWTRLIPAILDAEQGLDAYQPL